MSREGSAHGVDLPPEVEAELDAAWDEWFLSKRSLNMRINDVLDAYGRYAKLVRTYVDPNWS